MSSFSQIMGEDEVFLSGDLIEPRYEGGGLDGFKKIFYSLIRDKKVKKGEVVVASVIIDKNGLMKNIKIIRYKDDETAIIVLETIKAMNDLKTKWIPAKRLDKIVEVKLEFPFNF